MAKYTAGTDYTNSRRRPEQQNAPGKPIPGLNAEKGYNSRQPTRTVPGQGAMPTPAGAVKGDTGTAPTSGATAAPGAGVPGSGGGYVAFNSRATPEGNARAIMGSFSPTGPTGVNPTSPTGAAGDPDLRSAPPTHNPPPYPTSIGPLPFTVSYPDAKKARPGQAPQSFDAPDQTLPDYDAPGTD